MSNSQNYSTQIEVMITDIGKELNNAPMNLWRFGSDMGRGGMIEGSSYEFSIAKRVQGELQDYVPGMIAPDFNVFKESRIAKYAPAVGNMLMSKFMYEKAVAGNEAFDVSEIVSEMKRQLDYRFLAAMVGDVQISRRDNGGTGYVESFDDDLQIDAKEVGLTDHDDDVSKFQIDDFSV